MLVLGYSWVPFMELAMGEKKKDRIRVLYNAVETRESNGYNSSAKNLLFYGVLVPRKGIDDLLRAFSLILDQIPPEIMLTVYGADLENNIRQKIQSHGLEGRAVYCGWLEKKDQDRCFSQTMLNILPSYNEGLPMTILETMAYGIPNIASRIAAIPEVVHDGENGCLTEPGKAEMLAEKMKDLILDRSRRESYSRNAYREIREKYSLEPHLKQLYEIYGELMGERL